MAEKRSVSTDYSDGFWEQLKKKYTLVIEGNKATASVGGKRVAAVTATLDTDDANVLVDFGFDPSTSVSNMKIKGKCQRKRTVDRLIPRASVTTPSISKL